MKNLSSHGAFNEDALGKAKALLNEQLDFAESVEPLSRNKSGQPSAGGFINQHFSFGEETVSNFYSADLRRLRDALKIAEDNIARGYTYGDEARVKELRRELRDKVAQHGRNLRAAQSEAQGDKVETDNRGVLIPEYNEAAQEVLDFARCQRPDGSYYGTGGTCRKGSPTEAKQKEAPKGKSSGGGAGKAAAGGASKAKEAAAPDSKTTQANVRKMDKVAKEADKKAAAADKVYQKAEKDARKVEAKAAKAQAALRKDPQNQGKKDAFRGANMDARNARDRAALLSKKTRKLDRDAKKLNKAAEKLDKDWRKSQGIK